MQTSAQFLVIAISSLVASAAYTSGSDKFDVAKLQAKFLKEANVEGNDLFKDPAHFRLHTPELFRGMEKKHYDAFLSLSFDFSTSPATLIKEKRGFIDAITAQDLAVVIADEGANLIPMIPHIKEKFAEMNPKAVPYMLKAMDDKTKIAMKSLPRKAYVAAAADVLASVPDYNDIPKDAFAALIKEKEGKVCAKFVTKQLAALDKNHYPSMTPACFANIPSLDGSDAEIGSILKKFPATIFQDVSKSVKLHDQFFANATKEQITNFGKSQDEERGYAINPAAMGKVAATGMNKALLMSYLTKCAVEKKPAAPFGSVFWKNVPADLLGELTEDEAELVRLINHSDYVEMRETHLASIFKSEVACASLSGESVFHTTKVKPTFTVSAKCAEELKPKTLAWVLALVPTLPDDILANVTADVLSAATYTKGSKDYSGLELFNIMKAPNAVEIFRNASKEVSENHICKLASNNHVKEIKVFQDAVTRSCLEHSNIDLSIDDMAKNPKIFFLQPLEKWADSVPADFWEKVTQEQLSAMCFGDSKFGSEIDYERFAKIPESIYGAINGNTLAQLTFRKQLKKESFAKMGADAFAMMSDSDVAELGGISILSDEQMAHASSKIAEGKKSIALLVDGEVLSKMSNARIAKISAGFWSAVPAASFRKMKKEQFAAIPAAATTKMTYAQIKECPAATLEALTKEQAEMIGSEIKNKDDSPIRAFKPILGKLNSEARKVMEKRLGAAAGLVASSAAAAFAMIGAAVMLF